MQQLLLPFRRPVLSAAWKHPRYTSYYGYIHYGWDMGSDEAGYDVLALGDGEVVAAGMDGTKLHGPGANLGNCVVIVYRDVLDHDGKVRDLACRMYHFDSVAVKAGQRVRAGDVIGQYGDTYAKPCGKHLHIEFDYDVLYPCHAVGIAQTGNIIKRGTVDSTVDPAKVFWRTGGQTIRGCPGANGRNWYDECDVEVGIVGIRTCPTCGREL